MSLKGKLVTNSVVSAAHGDPEAAIGRPNVGVSSNSKRRNLLAKGRGRKGDGCADRDGRAEVGRRPRGGEALNRRDFRFRGDSSITPALTQFLPSHSIYGPRCKRASDEGVPTDEPDWMLRS
jgi:hypothetical protein